MNTPSVRLIDTNIVLRFLRGDDPILSNRAKSLFLDAKQGKFTCYIDEVAIAESVWVLMSVYKTKREDIAHGLETLLAKDWVVNPRKHIMLRALAFYRTSTLNYIDCWLLAVSKEKHISLETFDIKLKKKMGTINL